MRIIEQQNNTVATTETVVEYSWQYSRQQSIQDEERRKNLKVLIVWAGGIGSNSTYVLAKQWIENIKVVDFDTVELENTGSQLYNLSNVWQPKVEALQKNIKEFVGADIKIHNWKFTKSMVKGYDVIVLALDSLEVRKQVVECAEDYQIILDTRMVKKMAQCICFYGFQKDRWLAEKYTTDDNAIQEAMCTEKAIAFNASIMAGLVGSLVCDICNNKILKWNYFFDMENYQLYTYN